MANNQLDYISDYNKKNYKMYQFRVKKNDKEMIFYDNETREDLLITDMDILPIYLLKISIQVF